VKDRTVPVRRPAARWLGAVLLILACGVWAGGGAGAAPSASPGCDKYASPDGLDANPGSEQLPFSTAQRLADSLLPGQAGCLKRGRYQGGVTVTSGGRAGSPLTLQSAPGERAVLVGRVSILPGADYVTVAGLDLVGLNSPDHLPSPMTEASYTTIADDDITNLQSAGDCVFVGSTDHSVRGVTIARNRIHNCGLIPLTNRHQGISIWNATDTEITDNVIFENADRGIQLYPEAIRTHVARNTIDGNGEGVLLAGGAGAVTSNDNIVERNVITNSDQRDNIEVYWPANGIAGTGNVFRDNCVSGGRRDNFDGGVMPRIAGVALAGNVIADPGYADRMGRDYTLAPGSPCLPVINGTAWRPFRDDTIWNLLADRKGRPTADNPYPDQFTSYSSGLEISGIPGSGSGIAYAKPIFFAKAGDPVAHVNVGEPSWVKGDIRWDGKPIPVPAGVAPAPGSDGHLTIVSADRRTSWEMWRCTRASLSGYDTVTISQWDLTGSGVPNVSVDNSSARGSGTPVIPTTIRAQEALTGINHALGITVPHVSGDYLYPPATHSDGSLGANGIKYGMLFVLRPDFPVSTAASVGERNVIEALKVYGAYVVDQGASMELDADSTQPKLWAQTGLDSSSLNSIGPRDFRLLRPWYSARP
jgi:parallel beta-helix repeat protein